MTSSIAHPPVLEVPILGGQATARIPKWTMAIRAEVKPRIAALFKRIATPGTDASVGSLADLFMVAEDELVAICRIAVQLPPGLSWDEVLWEDIPVLVQAVWEHNVVTPDGKGIAGKLAPMVQPLLQAAARSAMVSRAVAASRNNPEKKPTEDSAPLKPTPLN